MDAPAMDERLLQRYKAALVDLFGERIDRIVLFGSRARGDSQPESDYDIAVFIKALGDRWPEFDRLAELRVDFLDKTGAFFDTLPFTAAAYTDRSPLMREIRRDGRTL